MDGQITNSKLSKFIQFLTNRLSQELPGHFAHLKFTPVIDNMPFRKFKPTPDAKPSSVMLLLTEIDGVINVLFTLRSKNLNSHGGQISFPGGRVEESEDKLSAAIRETFEETNIYPDLLQVVGELSPLFVPPSNSIIHPFIAVFDFLKSDLIANPTEVDEIFFVPLLDFSNKNLKRTEIWNFKGDDVEVPFWNVHGSTPLWGATAMILSEFLFISDNYITDILKNYD
jgi:8-oxo-dGTP pyrophosphatase MutT (NUDIX family)